MGRLTRGAARALVLATSALVLPVDAPAGAAAQDAEAGTFTLRQGGTVIATEIFERSADSLAIQLDVGGQATLVARATLRPDATVSRLAVQVYGPGGPTGEPAQTSAVTFEGGKATFEQPIGTRTGEPTDVAPGAVPYLNPSPSFIEQVLRRARALGEDTVAVPVWTPAPGGGRVLPTTVSFDGATAALTLAGVPMEATVDGAGRLLSARVPSQALVISRH